MPRISMNLLKYAKDSQKNVRTRNGTPIREFLSSKMFDWTDEFILKFEEASCEDRKNMIREILNQFDADDAEVFCRKSTDPEGIKPPVHTYQIKQKGFKEGHENYRAKKKM